MTSEKSGSMSCKMKKVYWTNLLPYSNEYFEVLTQINLQSSLEFYIDVMTNFHYSLYVANGDSKLCI